MIKLVAETGKPLLISTGMGTEQEIADALRVARNAGSRDILLFHCISSYPTEINEANLRKIINLRSHFGVEVGLSDHTLGNTAAITAVALGATAIEKHFTLSRNDMGPDSKFSMEPSELRLLVKDARDAWSSLGKQDFTRPNIETNNTIFRRSLYFVRDLKAGHKISAEDIRRIRPGYGLPPKYFENIIGAVLAIDVSKGEAVTMNSFIEIKA